MLRFSIINFINKNYLIKNQFNSINYIKSIGLKQNKFYSVEKKANIESVSNSDESHENNLEGDENLREHKIDPKIAAKDRTKLIPVEISIKYLKSLAYKETYGNFLVWEEYRRNHKGLFAPRKTRKTCIRKGYLSTGNPCPICRDEYLVLNERNIELLKQFISKQTGEVLSYTKTGLCQRKHQELLVAVERAMDCGLLSFDVPFRNFDYSEYYPNLKNNKN